MHATPASLPVFLSRAQISDAAWDACVMESPQRIVYGYAWYLDAVLPAPDSSWVGWVLPGQTGTYRAVMPVPLRRRYVAGVAYGWVVHQPLFCQLLDVFSRDAAPDAEPFFRAVQARFRYGATWHVRPQPAERPGLSDDPAATHVLDLSVGYDALYANYSRDRRINLRRAQSAGWLIADSTDPEPLLTLFRDYHAGGIRGGVGEGAYVTFRRLYGALHQRGLVTLRYALRNGQPEAGALFVREGHRIIYLFNAASNVGRRGNARTLLLDQLIREHAGGSILFDFESPDKASIVQFYQSFGVTAEPFRRIRWNRLSRAERWALRLKHRLERVGT